jgi:hypothetical protein
MTNAPTDREVDSVLPAGPGAASPRKRESTLDQASGGWPHPALAPRAAALSRPLESDLLPPLPPAGSPSAAALRKSTPTRRRSRK